MVDRHRLIGECRKLKQDGVDLESVVAAALCADPVGSNPPYGLWRAGAISIVGILACNHAESPMGSAMGGFANRAMMEWCR